MAKRVVAKKKGSRQKEIKELFSAEAQKKAERKVRRQLDEADERADELYNYAQKILEASPQATHEAVDRIVEVLERMAGKPRFRVDGIYVNVDPEILRTINRKFHVWIAVRLLVACAKWDIRIGDFKAPKHLCADCGKKVK